MCKYEKCPNSPDGKHCYHWNAWDHSQTKDCCYCHRREACAPPITYIPLTMPAYPTTIPVQPSPIWITPLPTQYPYVTCGGTSYSPSYGYMVANGG